MHSDPRYERENQFLSKMRYKRSLLEEGTLEPRVRISSDLTDEQPGLLVSPVCHVAAGAPRMMIGLQMYEVCWRYCIEQKAKFLLII